MKRELNNTCICYRTDENFTEMKQYECTGAYVSGNEPMIDVLCDYGELVAVSLNDVDFEFTLSNQKRVLDEETKKNMPYIRGKYNPEYGDNRICECGHTYVRHFDPYEDMDPVGCKYCGCSTFKEAKPTETEE